MSYSPIDAHFGPVDRTTTTPPQRHENRALVLSMRRLAAAVILDAVNDLSRPKIPQASTKARQDLLDFARDQDGMLSTWMEIACIHPDLRVKIKQRLAALASKHDPTYSQMEEA